jgi:hypothetical protein
MSRRSRCKNNIVRKDNKVICDITGFEYHASDMRKLSGTQKGLLVHADEWNPPHPQLKLRGKADRRNVKIARFLPPDDFSAPPQPEDL